MTMERLPSPTKSVRSTHTIGQSKPDIEKFKENLRRQNRELGNEPQFFKILDRSSVEDDAMRLPSDFIKKYRRGHTFPSAVYAKGPLGALHKMTLLKKFREYYFMKGWKGFARTQSLMFGDLVTFRFRCNETFHINIYSRSGTLMTADDLSNRKSMMKKNYKQTNPPKMEDQSCAAMPLANHDNEVGPSTVKIEVDTEEIQPADHQFEFTMVSSAVNPPYLLHVPRPFAKSCFPHHSATFFLYVAGSTKAWQIKYISNSHNKVFSAGWKDFVIENQLRIKDCCSFQKIDRRSFVVTIIRRNP